MKNRTPLIILAAIVLLTGGVVWWLDGIGDLHERRNQERIGRLGQWQPILQANHPDTSQLVSDQVGPTKGPVPVKANDRIVYRGEHGRYVMCVDLDNTRIIQLLSGPKRAYFITEHGSFTAPSNACEPEMSPRIAGIAAADTMTEEAATLFYDSAPRLADKTTLQGVCGDSIHQDPQKVQFAGCYTSQIYILQIDNPQVASEMNVTGAHEMLHAAYQRLSVGDRERIDKLLLAEQQQLNDSELNQEIELYSAEERVDELHSRLATQFGSLSSELEDYYKRYFADRPKIAGFHQAYRQHLDSLTSELDRLDVRLKELDRQAETHLAAGRIDRYNALVGPYNNQLERYNELVDQYNSLTAHTRPEPEQLRGQ